MKRMPFLWSGEGARAFASIGASGNPVPRRKLIQPTSMSRSRRGILRCGDVDRLFTSAALSAGRPEVAPGAAVVFYYGQKLPARRNLGAEPKYVTHFLFSFCLSLPARDIANPR
jgi:hypothetical protein